MPFAHPEGLFEAAVKLFVRRGEDLLVLRARNTGLGDFPGGRLACRDSLFDLPGALRRELLEELGPTVQLDVDPDPLFLSPYTSREGAMEVMGLWYGARWLTGDIRLSAEHTEVLWLPPAEALKHFTGHFRSALERYFALGSSAGPVHSR